MMDFSGLFDVFSKRPQPPVKAGKPLTVEFRYRVLKLCTTTFPDRPFIYNTFSDSADTIFWLEMHEKLSYLHGRASLAKITTNSWSEDAVAFLKDCNDDHFLDFIELVFKWERLWDSNTDPRELLKNVNHFFEVDDLPYYLTQFVFSRPESPKSELPPGVPPPRPDVFTSFGQVIANPQIIRRDSEVLHQTAIQPVLTLLAKPAFKAANAEFLAALKDYRQGDYGDCVAKCGSAFESVMKIVCEQKGWKYHSDAGKLLNTIMSKTRLPNFLKKPLLQTATIRNELGSAHGAGTQPRQVSRHLAQYTINLTASAVLLLVDEANS